MGVLAIRVIGIAALFCSDVFLGLLLGTNGFGEFSQIRAIILILGSIAMMGLDNYLIRETALLIERKSYAALVGVLGNASRVLFSLATGICLAIVCGVLLASVIQEGGAKTILIVGAAMLPALVITKTYASILRGAHRVIAGQALEHLISPLLTILAITFLWWLDISLHPTAAILIICTAMWASAFLARFTLRRTTKELLLTGQPDRISGLWKTSIPFAVIAIAQVSHSKLDILLLGFFKSEAESGIYTAAAGVSNLLVFALIAINIALAPVLASLQETHASLYIQNIVTKVARVGVVVAGPLIALSFIYSEEIISVYGYEFSHGSFPLKILVLGQLANIMCGPVILLMMMLGHEKKAAFAAAYSLGLHVLLSVLVIPSHGVVGAAAATAATACFLNIYMTILLIKNTGVDPTPFGLCKISKER